MFAMSVWFGLTLFVSSALLFLVQLLFARMVLPLLGGTPAVWNTCMVFFQAALLGGYAYAHAVPARLGVVRHALIHVGLIAAAGLLLPIALPAGWTPPADGSPVLWLLAVLAVTVGMPFFVVASSAPLLQRWFANTRHPNAGDPYFLYAASNAGSLFGLLAYPLALEPLLPLADQSRLWTAGYLLLLVLTVGCAVFLLALRAAPAPCPATPTNSPEPKPATLGWRPVRWVLLAFVPSSLLLSVTTHLTTDIAAIPLLWVLPLALYLATFVFAFSRRPILSLPFLARWSPLVVLILIMVLLTEATEPVWAVLPLHLMGLFWLGMLCHNRLAHERPAANELTAFYLWMAVGGCLGGVFNALIAPLLFDRHLEYPLVIVLACLLVPSCRAASAPWALRDLRLPALLGLLTVALALIVPFAELPSRPLNVAAIFAVPAVFCYALHERPVCFGLGVAAILLASSLDVGVHGRVEHRARSFFGVHCVTRDPQGACHRLVHGNTVHGQQHLAPEKRREPLAYYHRSGPAGRLFRALRGDARLYRVAFIGMGAGALASYGEPGQRWTFFEIDPAVARIARDRRLFSYLADSPAMIDVVLGDGRLSLARSGEKFGLIVVDAFTSDSIPTHLLTREALRMYRDHLTEDGLLLFHVSNRYLELDGVLAAVAADADPPLTAFSCQDPQNDESNGRWASHWVLLASRPEDIGSREMRLTWQRVPARPEMPVWRDDYTCLLRVMRLVKKD